MEIYHYSRCVLLEDASRFSQKNHRNHSMSCCRLCFSTSKLTCYNDNNMIERQFDMERQGGGWRRGRRGGRRKMNWVQHVTLWQFKLNFRKMKLLSSILNSSNHNDLITLDIVIPFFLPFPFFFQSISTVIRFSKSTYFRRPYFFVDPCNRYD